MPDINAADFKLPNFRAMSAAACVFPAARISANFHASDLASPAATFFNS